MKKILITAATFFGLVACKNNPTDKPLADTANRAALDQSQTVQMNGVSDTLIGSNGATYVRVDDKPAVATPARPVATAPIRHRTSGSRPGTSSTGNGTNNNTSTGTTATTTQKKGWSSATKGTLIGAGTGAVAGALIDKKHGRGAIIGGLVGAGGGYLIGHNKDKKKKQP